jgi:predicted nucleotidyltransferase
MKRETALRYVRQIHERLAGVGGIIPTPGCEHDAYKVNKVELFGSVAKGSLEPNDVDILIHGEVVPPRRYYTEGGPVILDKTFFHRTGVMRGRSSWVVAYIWLTKGMRKVSRHDAVWEEGLDLGVKVEIYPEYRFQE